MQAYESTRVAVNVVLFSLQNGELRVYLEKREKEPFCGKLELPGGLMRGKETAEETVARKLGPLAKTIAHMEQFHTFTAPDRDPRQRAISIGYLAFVPDASGEGWFGFDQQLAFDHEQIIVQARLYMKEHLIKEMVRGIMPESFPLNALQAAYEQLEQETYDNRNFRKKILSSGLVEETGKLESNVSHRPAKLYTFVSSK